MLLPFDEVLWLEERARVIDKTRREQMEKGNG